MKSNKTMTFAGNMVITKNHYVRPDSKDKHLDILLLLLYRIYILKVCVVCVCVCVCVCLCVKARKRILRGKKDLKGEKIEAIT